MGFTHHVVDLATDRCEAEKPLLFILDPPKDVGPPKKKAKGKEPRAWPKAKCSMMFHV